MGIIKYQEPKQQISIEPITGTVLSIYKIYKHFGTDLLIARWVVDDNAIFK